MFLLLPVGLIVLGGLLLIGLLWASEPPSLANLKSHFAVKKTDLEEIVRMANEDAAYSRIAPTFLDKDGTDQGRYMEGDPRVGLNQRRWDAYREVYKRNGIKLGIQRDRAGDSFIMVDSEGLLNRGHTSGYLLCKDNLMSEDPGRFEPCTQKQDAGSHQFDQRTHEEGYSFQRIAGSWFAFDQGPS